MIQALCKVVHPWESEIEPQSTKSDMSCLAVCITYIMSQWTNPNHKQRINLQHHLSAYAMDTLPVCFLDLSLASTHMNDSLSVDTCPLA